MRPKFMSIILVLFFLVAPSLSSLQNYRQCQNGTKLYEICPFGNFSEVCNPHRYHPNLQCGYIKCCCPRTIQVGLVDYLRFEYCKFERHRVLGALILLVILLYLFVMLGTITDEYFAPIMEEASNILKISDNLAGVTFLALGNGAADLAVSIGAFRKGGKPVELGFGDLLGTAVFDPFICIGVIPFLVKPPIIVDKKPFIRDCIFLVLSVLWVYITCRDKHITLFEALGMILLYVLYVSIVFGVEYYQKGRNKITPNETKNDGINSKMLDYASANSLLGGSVISDSSVSKIVTNEHENESVNSSDTSSDDISKSYSCKRILFLIIYFPVTLVLKCCDYTVPSTSYESWDVIYSLASCLIGPTFIAYGLGFINFEMKFLYEFTTTIGIGILLFLIMLLYYYYEYKTNKDELIEMKKLYYKEEIDKDPKKFDTSLIEINSLLDIPPLCKAFYLFFGFFTSISWTNLVANEVVNILTVLGVISTIDLGILGLTLLTWGNSLNDLIACGSVAKRGFYKMAISGAVSGPLLNILLGSGFGLLALTISRGGASSLPFDIDIFVSCWSAIGGALFIMLYAYLIKWHLNKVFGAVCIAFYIGSVVFVVLARVYL